MGMAFNGFSAQSLAKPVSLDINTNIAPPRPGFDDAGGTGEKLRRLAAHLMIAGGNQQGGSALLNELQQQQEQESQMAYRRAQLALQGQIANTRADTEPALIKSLKGLGIDPTSAEGRAAGLSNLSRPIVVGNGESGFNVMGGAFGMPGSAPVTPSAPQIGTVEDGYVFIGGDPSNPASWKKQ